MAHGEARGRGALRETEGRTRAGSSKLALSAEPTSSEPLLPAHLRLSGRPSGRTALLGPLRPRGARAQPPGAGRRCGSLSGPGAAGSGPRGGPRTSVCGAAEMDCERPEPSSGSRRHRDRAGPVAFVSAGNKTPGNHGSGCLNASPLPSDGQKKENTQPV